jgi:Organic solute transporter Ostalpha
MIIEAGAVSIAMYCIIQFYVQLKDDIREHKPLLKVAAIKLVIFLSFWQTLAISLLTGTGAIKPSNQIQAPDIKIGIPAMLLDIEMAIFAIFHLWAFSWRPYTLRSKQNLAESVPGHDLARTDYRGGPLGISAIFEAFNPWDLVKAVGRAAKWLFVGRRRRTEDVSYQNTRTATENELHLNAAHNDNNPNIYPPIADFQRAGGLAAPATKHYASSDSEDQELLRNAQGNPTSRPPLQRGDSSPDDSGVNVSGSDLSRMSSDIGVARSIYEGDDNSDPARFDETGPPLPARHHQDYGRDYGGHQDTGVVPAPYPDWLRERSREDGVPVPYFPPPPRI